MSVLGAVLLSVFALQPTLPPVNPDATEVEVLAVGCVSGQTLTESTLTHNPNAGQEGLNPNRRWQLVLSAERLRRLRDAANLFAALEDSGGPTARDGAWRHPDLAPAAADLDDPLGYVERTARPQADEMDAALDRLLSGEDDA